MHKFALASLGILVQRQLLSSRYTISTLNLIRAAIGSQCNLMKVTIESMISLEMKCPQLSKPEATEARNQNSICDRMEKKPWEKTGSVRGPVPLWPDEPAVCSDCSKVRL